MGLRKYPPKITKDEWNNLIDFLGGETIDALLSQNKLADKFTQTEHNALPNPHHPETHTHPDKADKPHNNTQHSEAYLTTETDPTVDSSLKGITLIQVRDHAPKTHEHPATEITSETLDGDRLPAMSATKKGGVPATGTPAGKYLKDDGTWETPAGGGVVLPAHISFLQDGVDVAWTNMPAALTEFQGLTTKRTKDELTNATQARLIVNIGVVGATNAEIRAQYSTDQSTWYYLDNVDGPKANIATLGLRVSAWITLVAGAKADVFLRLVGINGDGAKDPKFGGVQLQFK